MSDVRTFTVGPDDEGVRVDRWFKRNLPEASHALLARWARTGQLRVDGRRAELGDRLTAGQVLRVPPLAAPQEPAVERRPAPRPLGDDETAMARAMVLHKDEAALVLNKPPGLATQGGTGTTVHVDGMLDALRFERADRPRLVHRLDKDTSGVLLVARSANAAGYFSKAFAGREADKVYWALVMGVPERRSGVINFRINKQPGTGGEKMMVDAEHGQSARTLYRVVERAGDRAAWLELRPLTGRTHQLRVHCAAIGHPIVGDGKYGGVDAQLTGGVSRKLHLHARALSVPHPDGSALTVLAPLPPHMAASWALFGFDTEAQPAPRPEPRTEEPSLEMRSTRRGERRLRGQPEPRRKRPARPR